jgi:polysaccharide pyruvyl transferase WcaK-like protein
MARIVLAGAFGQRNPGDDALLESFAQALAGHELVATSSTPVSGVPGCEVVTPSDPTAVMRRVRSADAVVFAGGTIFKELRPATGRAPMDLLARALAMGFGTRALGKSLALVGVGAAPLHRGRSRLLARRLVHQADLLVLRDEESADVLVDAGAPAPFRIGADAAWPLLDRHLDIAPGARDEVVVALSHDAGDHELADEIAAMLVPVLAAGLPVSLQPWQVGRVGRRDDIDLARAVNARLGGTARLEVPPADLLEARERFAGARLVVAQRFHALVAAASAGAPAIAYAHEPKLAGLARRLAQPLLCPGEEPAHLGAAIRRAAQTAQPPSAAAVRAQYAAAEEGFRLLRLVLDGGRNPDADTIGSLPLRPAAWERHPTTARTPA